MLLVWSLTFERAEQLRKQKAEKAAEVDLLEATTPEQIWLADLDAIEHLLDERDKSLGFDEKRSCGKTKINTTVAKNKYAKRKLDEDEVSSNVVVLLIHAIVDQRNNNFLMVDTSKWNSNESEVSDEQSASDSDSEDDKFAAEAAATKIVSMPIAKKAKTSSSTKTLSMVDAINVSTGDIKGKRVSTTKSKARKTSEGKLVCQSGRLAKDFLQSQEDIYGR